jgi:nucleotide-binding universal stress UspA family protein
MKEREVLEQAKDLLVESGIDAARLDTICEGKCHDAAAAMLKLANLEGLDPIVLARRREPLLERMLMGPVTYRLVQMAEWRTVWLIDPPVSSHDVLVALVGVPISRRVMEHAVHHFGHLSDSKFTLFHVIPPMPPMYWDDTRIFDGLERQKRDSEKARWMQEYAERVKEFAEEGKNRLISEGVPEENVAFKVQAAKKGMAGDILSELEQGNYGILVIGRKGSKEISPFRLGSIANKLLHNAQRCVICLVN